MNHDDPDAKVKILRRAVFVLFLIIFAVVMNIWHCYVTCNISQQ